MISKLLHKIIQTLIILGIGSIIWYSNQKQKQIQADPLERELDDISYKDSEILKEIQNDQNTNLNSDLELWTQTIVYLHNIFLQNMPIKNQHYLENFNKPHMGLINEPDYCIKSDTFKLINPHTVLEQYNIFTEFARKKLGRRIIQQIANDTAPHVSTDMGKALKQQRLFTFALNTSLLYTHETKFINYHQVGKNIICLFQTYNHVPGKFSITGKDLVINNIFKYMNNFEAENQCRNTIQFVPETYRLYNEKECKAFFKFLNSEKYQKFTQMEAAYFVTKFGRDVHKGKGVTVIFQEEEQQLRQQYSNGLKCGVVNNILIAQRYIHNPLLYKGNKLEFRIYFLIASTDPLIVYSQDHAHIKRCGVQFDKKSKKKEVHVCNTAILRKKVLKVNDENASLKSESNNINNDNNTQNINNISNNTDDNEYIIDWHLTYLQQILMEQGKLDKKKDTEWLQKELYPQIYRTIIHLIRAGKKYFFQDSRFFELFAIDFLLDENLHLWLLENNFNPQILAVSAGREKRHRKMFEDIFEIQFKYLRSRFTRIQKFAHRIKKQIQQNLLSQLNKTEMETEFWKINKNYLEPRQEISAGNTFTKIMDLNNEGLESYMGYLPEECLQYNDEFDSFSEYEYDST